MHNSKHVIEYFAKEKEQIMCELLLRKWQILKEIVYILKIPLRATIQLQKQDLTLSDAFGIWIQMKLHFNACNRRGCFKTNLSKHLTNALEARKKLVFCNTFMKSALYLDPRYRRMILSDPSSCTEAKDNLRKLWHRINATESTLHETEDAAINPAIDPADDPFNMEFDLQSEFNKYVSRDCEEIQSRADFSQTDIEHILDLFDPPQIPVERSIIEYWDSMKLTEPELYQLAMVVFAIPPTEVQIERDFSQLKFVFTDKRTLIQQERLEDIMLIKINPELFYQIKEEEMNALRKQMLVQK